MGEFVGPAVAVGPGVALGAALEGFGEGLLVSDGAGVAEGDDVVGETDGGDEDGRKDGDDDPDGAKVSVGLLLDGSEVGARVGQSHRDLPRATGSDFVSFPGEDRAKEHSRRSTLTETRNRRR